jgi:integrase
MPMAGGRNLAARLTGGQWRIAPGEAAEGSRVAMAKQRGLFEKVTGSGVWWICYFDSEHKRRREKAGTWSNARDLYHKRKLEALQGRKLPETLRPKRLLFSTLADDAIVYVRNHNEGHAIDVHRIEALKRDFGSGPAEIPIETLRKWFDSHGGSAGSYNRYRTVLSGIYRLAIENKKVSINPAKLLKRKRESDGRVRFLSSDEEKRIRQEIAKHCPVHTEEFDIALNTGMRRSEQYRVISWQDVDLKHRDLFVQKSKNGRARHIPLNDTAMRAFNALHGRTEGNGPIFANPRDGKRAHGPRHWFEGAVRMAKVKDFTWHDCRHTFASRLVIQGVPLRAVADLLGHRTIQMTMRYAHLAQGDKLEAVRKLDGLASGHTAGSGATRSATAQKRRSGKSRLSY